jgi:TolB protein
MRRILSLFFVLAFASPLAAQQDTTRLPSGVRLGLIYQTLKRPSLAVRPFTGEGELASIAAQAGEIVGRDLDYSDRFEIYETPPQLKSGALEYPTWNKLGVVYLVTGSVEPSEGGALLRVALHDVVYGRVRQSQAFPIPAPGARNFRMAVHAISDEVVRWATGQPGMAASRILFVRHNADGVKELMVVDSDGAGAERVTSSREGLMSPSWSPDGQKVVYSQARTDGSWYVHERSLASGQSTVISGRPGLNMTPTYSPDGKRIAMALENGRAVDLYDYDVEKRCCVRQLRAGPGTDISPSYSPDGRKIAFMSDRLGQPHIYVMPADGGEAQLISPYAYGEPGYYTSPAWAPEGSLIAFHGRSRGQFQLMVADAAKPGTPVQQITQEGVSEDPSWAPDGRHLVFSGVRGGAMGIYVVDIATGRTRPLVVGGRMRLPDWSPTLEKARGQ